MSIKYLEGHKFHFSEETPRKHVKHKKIPSFWSVRLNAQNESSFHSKIELLADIWKEQCFFCFLLFLNRDFENIWFIISRYFWSSQLFEKLSNVIFYFFSSRNDTWKLWIWMKPNQNLKAVGRLWKSQNNLHYHIIIKHNILISQDNNLNKK